MLSCLSHPDVAIQRRTLHLVLILATKENLPAVLDRIVAYVKEKEEDEQQGRSRVRSMGERERQGEI